MAVWAFFPLIVVILVWSAAHLHVTFIGHIGIIALFSARSGAVLLISSYFGVFSAISVIQLLYILDLQITQGDSDMDVIGRNLAILFSLAFPLLLFFLYVLVII